VSSLPYSLSTSNSHFGNQFSYKSFDVSQLHTRLPTFHSYTTSSNHTQNKQTQGEEKSTLNQLHSNSGAQEEKNNGFHQLHLIPSLHTAIDSLGWFFF
jgi:hypothetical protein